MVYYRDEDLQDYATPQSWEDAAMVSDLFGKISPFLTLKVQALKNV